MVLNSSLVTGAPPEGRELLLVPATEAAEAVGNQRVANVVMLGAFLARRPIVTVASLTAAMTKTAQEIGAERLLPINLQALERGVELGAG